MSTLTKILIVLLAFSSFFLCGVVVTYVANADNYRQKLDELSSDKDSLSKKVKELTKQANDKADQKKQVEDKLSGEIASLNSRASELKTSLENSEREKAGLISKIDGWASITKDFYQTNDKQAQLLKNTMDELNKVQTEQANARGELDKVTAELTEKKAAISTLEEEKQQLLNEKAQLQSKVEQMLNPSRRISKAPVVSEAPKKDTAKSAAAAVSSDAALQGKLTAVDSKNSMASISIGKADGVKEGMKFHVTRGDEFICDIQIVDVETNEAVGAIELVQKQPQIGDIASSSL